MIIVPVEQLTDQNVHSISKEVLSKIINAKKFKYDFNGEWNGSKHDAVLTELNIEDYPQLVDNFKLMEMALNYLPENYLTDKKVEKDENNGYRMSFGTDSEKINGLLERFAKDKAIGLEEAKVTLSFDKEGVLTDLNINMTSQKQNGWLNISNIRVFD